MAHGENAAKHSVRKDLWKRRPMSIMAGIQSSKWAKTVCHRIERRAAAELERKAKQGE